MQTTSERALELCQAIESAGCSEQLTKCSVIASELRLQIHARDERDARLIESLNLYAAECFPEINAEGQKHFVRVLMEGWAQEYSEPLTA